MPPQKDFNIIPDTDAIEATARDLRFFPASVDEPKTLSADQIRSFNEDGFLKGIRIFDAAETLENRRYFDALLEKILAQGGDSYSISTAHLKYGKVYDLLAHPRIVACVRDLLGDDVVAWGSHYFCKMPRDDKTAPWHQDASYWPMSPSRTVTVWLAIDDADRDNACMRFISGSHRLGHLPYRRVEKSANAVLDQEVDDAETHGESIDVELEAGEISMHSDLLLHGSSGNRSDRRRCGLTLRYCEASVRASMGWNAKGVVVSGTDSSGHWANPPRPAED